MKKIELHEYEMFVHLASKFVDNQKVLWEHNRWLDFLLEMQKKGIDVSDEMKTRFGQVLESMKKVYNTLSGTSEIENIMVEISEHMFRFSKNTENIWSQSQWEILLGTIEKKGIELNDELRVYFMEFILNMNDFYSFISGQTEEVEEIVEGLSQTIILPHGLKELIKGDE
jgi:hypothetical protein